MKNHQFENSSKNYCKKLHNKGCGETESAKKPTCIYENVGYFHLKTTAGAGMAFGRMKD